MKDNVTAIINGYKRANNVDHIVLSLLNQSCRPQDIFIWWNDKEEFKKARYARFCKNIVSDENLGVWARFTFALNSSTEFIVVFDDDTIPGHRWIENCLNHSHLGLLGTIVFNIMIKSLHESCKVWGPTPTLNQFKSTLLVTLGF